MVPIKYFFLCLSTCLPAFASAAPALVAIKKEVHTLQKRWALTGEYEVYEWSPTLLSGARSHLQQRQTPEDYWKSILISFDDSETILGLLKGDFAPPGFPICIRKSETKPAVQAALSISKAIILRSQFDKILQKTLKKHLKLKLKAITPHQSSDRALQLTLQEWTTSISAEDSKRVRPENYRILVNKLTSEDIKDFNKTAEKIVNSQDFEIFVIDFFHFTKKTTKTTCNKTEVSYTLPTMTALLSYSFSSKALGTLSLAAESTEHWENLESGLACYITNLHAAITLSIEKREKHLQSLCPEISELF